MTNFCQAFAIFSDIATTIATAKNGKARYGFTKYPAPKPTSTQTKTRNAVTGLEIDAEFIWTSSVRTILKVHRASCFYLCATVPTCGAFKRPHHVRTR